MTRQIHRVAFVLLMGYAVVALAVGYWQVVRGPALASNPALNAYRIQQNAERIPRGRILDRNGVPLAENVRGADGLLDRVYHERSLAHTIGYASRRYGLAGVEAAFDRYLRGDIHAPMDLLAARLFNRPLPGADVRLTIDQRVQRVAAAALGDSPGAVIALNPRTGEVLAIVSAPTFDPNTLDESFAQYASMPNTPLLNRATQGLYAPGSTFKTVTLVAALDQRLATPETMFDCQDQYVIGGFAIACDPVGNYNLAHAYAWSCNASFAQLGLQVGPDRLTRYARAFGFESVPPIEIAAEASLIQSDPNFIDGDIARAVTGMGQGQLLATPLQMAIVAATVANGGEVPPVHLFYQAWDSDKLLADHKPGESTRIMRPETAQTVKQMMVQGVQDGWARTAAIPGVSVGGKTGTAEVGPGQKEHAWFIGFAPAEDPIVAVAVIKEHAGQGSQEAGPIARQVMAAALEAAERP